MVEDSQSQTNKQPLDQALYDAAYLVLSPDQRQAFEDSAHPERRTPWVSGYVYGITQAARIAAERATYTEADINRVFAGGKVIGKMESERATVSDAELGVIFAETLEREHAKGAASNKQELGQQFMAGVRAVRAALSPVPQIPEGWTISDDRPKHGGRYVISLRRPSEHGLSFEWRWGEGANRDDALNAAIQQTKEVLSDAAESS